MTNAGFNPIRSVTAKDENGQVRTVQVASEIPLTLLMNDDKIVRLMTLGHSSKGFGHWLFKKPKFNQRYARNSVN